MQFWVPHPVLLSKALRSAPQRFRSGRKGTVRSFGCIGEEVAESPPPTPRPRLPTIPPAQPGGGAGSRLEGGARRSEAGAGSPAPVGRPAGTGWQAQRLRSEACQRGGVPAAGAGAAWGPSARCPREEVLQGDREGRPRPDPGHVCDSAAF